MPTSCFLLFPVLTIDASSNEPPASRPSSAEATCVQPARPIARPPTPPAEALAPTHGSSSGIRSINHKAICKMTRRRGRRLIFAECAAATCDNARVECARARGSYTGCRERNTGICVRCHGAHNRCDCRANLLRCYGDGNLAEGGRADRKRGVGSEKKKK